MSWACPLATSPLSLGRALAFAAAAVSVAAASTIEPASATSSEKSAVAPEGGTVVETAKSRMARRAGFEYRKQCRWMPDSHHCGFGLGLGLGTAGTAGRRDGWGRWVAGWVG